MLHKHQWGTVCDDSWDEEDAAVVCRHLGCGMVVSAPGAAQFGKGHNAIWLDDVNCTGKEDTLSECLARPWVHTTVTMGKTPVWCAQVMWPLLVCKRVWACPNPGKKSRSGWMGF